MNIPNRITLVRLGLAVVFIAVLSSADPTTTGRLAVAFWLFLVAALTDVLDGYLARRWGQVSTFGRVIDPFVDKVLICSAFVLLAGPQLVSAETGESVTGVAPWMAVVILAREMLVSALRAQSEAAGRDFSADYLGKAKMLTQSVTVCLVLGALAFRPFHSWLPAAQVAVWITVVVTGLSMITYLRRAWPVIFSSAALSGTGSGVAGRATGDRGSETNT